jgi:hypothetical protein
MPSPEGVVILAGGTAFVGAWKEENGFPEKGYVMISATIALVFLASFSKDSAFEGPVKALAGLMLLAAIYRYVPGLIKKGKTNG